MTDRSLPPVSRRDWSPPQHSRMVLYDDDDERPAKGKYYFKPRFLKGFGKYSNLYQNETYAFKKHLKSLKSFIEPSQTVVSGQQDKK